MNKKGFTLIELLVVIAIIAILSVVVILTLNPAELLKQARDSNRLSDLSTMKTALSQYLADVGSPVLSSPATYVNCGESAASSSRPKLEWCGFNTSNTYVTTIVASSSRAVDGTGWIPVAFTGISSGAPISNLPVDPLNTGANVYRYVASTTLVFEIDALMESSKQTSATGIQTLDGGSSSTIYEAGTNLYL